MLCKRTYKNQITLPKKVMENFDGVEYFVVSVKDGAIVLKPAEITPLGEDRLEKVREKMMSLGLTEKDIQDAVKWARRK